MRASGPRCCRCFQLLQLQHQQKKEPTRLTPTIDGRRSGDSDWQLAMVTRRVQSGHIEIEIEFATSFARTQALDWRLTEHKHGPLADMGRSSLCRWRFPEPGIHQHAGILRAVKAQVVPAAAQCKGKENKINEPRKQRTKDHGGHFTHVQRIQRTGMHAHVHVQLHSPVSPWCKIRQSHVPCAYHRPHFHVAC
jgi:hypothetical protein